MHKNIERYFEPCDNCGACCKTPGIFLPDQIDLLVRHLRMDREEFFRRYLIAELFTPHVESVPAFVLAPVKTDSEGNRTGSYLSDAQYARAADKNCIFRDNAAALCGVHEYKPFGCSLLICGKMTRAKPITLNKTYYYHRWINSQEILFTVFPQLVRLYQELNRLILKLPSGGLDRRISLKKGNSPHLHRDGERHERRIN
jgi:Fe-S-cluster containining protein